MRLDKFTLRGQEAIQSAIELAERNQHQQVEPEHLLVAMLEQPEGIVRPILGKLGTNVAVVLNDTIVPSGALAVGTPAVIKEGRARREDIETGVASYVERAARFATELRRID